MSFEQQPEVQWLLGLPFEKLCPLTYKAIYGRRFLLPHYRQNDYASQDELARRMQFDLTSIAMGLLNFKDDVLNAQFSNYCGALASGRPVLYLERELGQGLAESPLPTEMVCEDVLAPWPQVRIMLPKELLGIEREGGVRSMDFMDISLIGSEGWGLPEPYASELAKLAEEHAPDKWKTDPRNWKVLMGETYISVSCQTSYSEHSIGPTTYAFTAPWNQNTIGAIQGYQGGMESLLECDEADNAMLERLKRLAINVLLFLSQKPYDYQPKVRRPVRYEGKHLKPALHDAHFVGREVYKAVLLKQPSSGPGVATGRKLPAHFVKGHWTRQPHGPGRTLRRWQWIGFYWTKGSDGAEKQPSSQE